MYDKGGSIRHTHLECLPSRGLRSCCRQACELDHCDGVDRLRREPSSRGPEFGTGLTENAVIDRLSTNTESFC